MKKNKILSISAISIIAMMIGGCNATAPKPIKHNWESLSYKPQMESCSDIDKKFLKSYSFMQILQELAERDNMRFSFTPSSQDLRVEKISFLTWEDALFWLEQQNGYSVRIDGYASSQKIKTIDIKKIAPSPFELIVDAKAGLDKNDNFSIDYGRVSTDKEVAGHLKNFAEDYKFEYSSTLSKFLNDFYYYYLDEENRDIFFNFDEKSKTLQVKSYPSYIAMTPYKMRIFKNYLDTNNIFFVEVEKDRAIYIKDNFILWKKAMLYLVELNKYHNQVYGVKTPDGYYEISDGKYPATPLAIELITWTPYGEREYNVYYDKKSRKIITKDRNFVFFSEDTNRKFIIRTY